MVSEIPGPKAGIIELLDHFTTEMKKANTSSYNPLRPSGSGKCTKQLAYAYQEYKGLASYKKRGMEPNVVRLLSLGHYVEDSLVQQFKQAFNFAKEHSNLDINLKYQQQVVDFFEVEPGKLIEGSVDGCFVAEKWGMLIDFKSKKDKFHSWFKTDWAGTDAKLAKMESVRVFGTSCYWVEDLDAFLYELDDDLFADNFLQLNFYYHSECRFFQKRNVTSCAILQYNKNDSMLREIRFNPSKALYEKVKNKFLTAAKHAVNNSVNDAPRDFALSSAKCAFCEFNYLCRPDSEALQSYLDTWPTKKWPTKVANMSQYKELTELFESLEKLEEMSKKRNQVEKEILVILEKAKERKVQLPNNHVYEVKQYKTGGLGGGPRMALKRGKK